MEAALRTVAETVTGKPLDKVEFEAVRGTEGIKTAEVDLGGKAIKVAVVNTLSKAREIMEQIKKGECEYTFIEVMACPGGCVNGGGQPIVPAPLLNKGVDPRKLRAEAIYAKDAGSAIRKSHENPVIKKLYAEYFEKPGSHIAHKVLHTTYVKREKM